MIWEVVVAGTRMLDDGEDSEEQVLERFEEVALDAVEAAFKAGSRGVVDGKITEVIVRQFRGEQA